MRMNDDTDKLAEQIARLKADHLITRVTYTAKGAIVKEQWDSPKSRRRYLWLSGRLTQALWGKK